MQTPSIAFRHLPPKEGCRKPVLGVWDGLMLLYEMISSAFPFIQPDSLLFLRSAWIGLTPCFVDSVSKCFLMML